jgi:flagellar basal-body rod protein FlgC
MDPIEISAAGMRAQRARMDVIAANLANGDTTSARTEVRDGEVRHVPFRRKLAVLFEGAGGLPAVTVVEDRSEFRAEHQPGHPHASAAGTVLFPNVDPMVEMVEMMAASRAYEANLTAVEVAKSMHQSALRILG